jgi:hypothetical protein
MVFENIIRKETLTFPKTYGTRVMNLIPKNDHKILGYCLPFIATGGYDSSLSIKKRPCINCKIKNMCIPFTTNCKKYVTWVNASKKLEDTCVTLNIAWWRKNNLKMNFHHGFDHDIGRNSGIIVKKTDELYILIHLLDNNEQTNRFKAFLKPLRSSSTSVLHVSILFYLSNLRATGEIS